MIWAKSRDPFGRIWFTVRTAHYGKVKGVAVLPVRKSAVADRTLQLPVVFYVYGSGGSLLNSGNELRQLAELGMAAVAIEYNQNDQAAFDEQFIAARKWAASNAELRTGNAECWIGFSLGAERTLRFLLDHPEMQPQLYVRLAGGVAASRESAANSFSKSPAFSRNAATKVLLVHGENDEIFPIAEAKEVAAFFQTNGISTELKILPGKSHAFDADRAVVIREVGEYIKAQLTPEHSLPEFPVTKNYPYVLCILPAFLWIGFWIYLRIGNARVPRAVAGVTPDHFQSAAELHSAEFKLPSATRQHRCVQHPKLKKWEIGLRVAAIILATLAIAQTGIHLITPRLAISDSTLRIARRWLLAPKWNGDFETLAAKPFWQGQRLKTLLTHVELANYCVYELINWKVDKAIYNDFVLSPVIEAGDGSPSRLYETNGELNWRRPLWEFFYPRIRKEDSPESAAEIVMRNLRERVTIVTAEFDAQARWPTGIETIWRNQITNEKGFQRIYVAALRSVGVGARLNITGDAEFWTGSEWKTAPRTLISYWLR